MAAKQSGNKSGNKRIVKTQTRGKSTPSRKSKAEVKARVSSVSTSTPKSKSKEQLPFTRKNYLLLLLGIGIIAVGFFLMSLEPFIDATQFSIALYIAPIVVVGGFIEVIFAIMYKEKTPEKAADLE